MLVLGQCSDILGVVDIFHKLGKAGSKKYFMYTKCCAKGFFSEISILEDFAKKGKKNEKMHFSL